MIHRCQMTDGFFIQRQCGREGVVPCQQCGKLVCRKHRSADDSAIICLECAPEPQREEDQWEGNHGYAYRRRRSHFGSGYYYPHYGYGFGHHHHHDHHSSTFNEDEQGAFDPQEGDAEGGVDEFPDDDMGADGSAFDS